MSREWEPKKSTVELRESRIRREPAPRGEPTTLVKLQERSRGWEMGIAVAGMILFALAIEALWAGVNAFLIG